MNSLKLNQVFLVVMILLPLRLFAQIPYGNNPDAGKYIQTKDAKIYYEVYGEGEPLLLIHGSVFGYINEFAHILPTLTKEFKVIAVALRGHGKSEIGKRNFSYALLAQDAIQVLDAEGVDSTNIIGFSAGAITALRITAIYPNRVMKTVSIAGALNPGDSKPQKKVTAEDFVANYKGFVDSRKQLMPEPDRFIDFYNKLEHVNDAVWVSDESASNIDKPVMIIGGDSDSYFSVEAFNRAYTLIPNSRLMIIPKSGHVDALLNMTMYNNFVIPFLVED